MRRNWLIISLVCVLCLVLVVRAAVQFGLPAFLRAQGTTSGANEVGPHAAFFDSGNNIKVANMVKSKTPKNLRITVMVDISAQTAEINSILAATNGLTPQVRIVGVNKQTKDNNPGKAGDIARALNGSSIQPGTLVVFGNEVNNLDKEWRSCAAACGGDAAAISSAASEYAAFFNEFRGAADSSKYTPVPSPLDLYNGVYTDPQPFFATGIYGGTLVANVYEVGPGLGTWSQYPGNVVAFTEFGPDPAKSLQEHVNWFKTHTPEKPATTLIPDKCGDGEGEDWLYYVDGKIYDAEGNEIDPVTCSGGRRGLPPVGDYYKRFIYPFYSAESTPESIRQKLEADYSMTCSNPAEYATQVSGSIQELIRYQLGQCKGGMSPEACFFSPESVFSLTTDGSNRLFGVMRNENEAKWRAYDYDREADSTKRLFTNRFESVEQWFGANNPSEQQRLSETQPIEPINYMNQTPDEISGLHQGPFYKLTPALGQCVAATEILKASSDLCAEWAELNNLNASDCTLTKKEVPGTTRTMGQLWGDVSGAGGGEGFCNAVYGETSTPSQSQLELAQDVANVDLYMETAYRPAFLVLVTRVDDENVDDENQKILAQDRGGSTGKDIVDFLVYHVPDTITDVKADSAGGVDDIMTRTVRPFLTTEQTKEAEDAWAEQRSGLAGALANPPPTGDDERLVDCVGGECSGDNEKLRRALIDFINAYIATVPGASECLNPNQGQNESGTRIGSELAPNDSSTDFENAKNGEPIGEANVAVRVEEYVDQGNKVVNRRDPVPKTRIFNIAPYGFRTKYVADAFDALFSMNQQEDEFNTSDKYLTTFEAIFGNEMESEPDIVTYSKQFEPPVFDDEGNELLDRKEVRDEIKLAGHPPFSAPVEWLAKTFNYSTRAVVQQITSSGEALLECARAVGDPKKNTEDFLLSCQSRGVAVGAGNTAGAGTMPVPDANCSISGGYEIQSTELRDLLVSASRQYNVPVQVLMAVLYVENCRSGATICNKSDAELAQYLTSDHVPYPGTIGCPGQDRQDGTGVFQFNLFYWQAFRDGPQSNACAIPDSFYDAARWLSANYSSNGSQSAIGTAPAASTWSVDKMKLALTRWAANVDTCGEHEFANYYCDVIDMFMTGSSDSVEPPVQRLTALTTSCN